MSPNKGRPQSHLLRGCLQLLVHVHALVSLRIHHWLSVSVRLSPFCPSVYCVVGCIRSVSACSRGGTSLFFELGETTLQNLFGIRKHHDAGPDIGKRSAFSRPSRRIGGFCIGETPQQGAHTRAQHHIIFACLQAHNQSQKRLNISSFFFSFFLILPLLQDGYTILSHYGAEW